VTGYAELPVGTIFASDFRIERLLARGGMGAVYIAHQLSTGRERALKLMHGVLAQDENMRRRFEQEAKIGSRIKSNHVVEVLAAGIDAQSGMPWLAMELLEGEDLASYVKRRGPLAIAEVEQILSQMCHALAAAHAVGVVHRDLKPENVFLSRALQQGAPTIVKLLDLGIAKIVAEAHPRDTAAVGTPLWMAPEQTGGTVGPQADVWAIGLLTFWMLTGRCYWRSAGQDGDEGSLMGVLREVVVDPLEPARLRAGSFGCSAELPDGFDAWFARCIVRDPAERFASASEAHLAFTQLLAGTAETMLFPSGLRVEARVRSPSATPETQAQGTTAGGATIAQSVPIAHAGRWVTAAVAALILAAVAFALTRRSPEGARGLATPSANAGVSVASAVASAATGASATPTAEPRIPADIKDSSIVWKIPIGDSPQRGGADAPVTIVEFANFQCPFSKGVEAGLRKILDEHPGKVRLVWKDDPLAVHSQAEVSSTVAREARAQKGDTGFWAAHDLFLEQSFRPSVKTLLDAAKKLELDLPRVEKAMAERSYAAPIAADAEIADDFMAVGTPYFFVNGRRAMVSPTLDQLRLVVEEELKRADDALGKGAAAAGYYERTIGAGRGGLPLEIKNFPMTTISAPARGSPKAAVTLLEFCEFKNYLCKLVDGTVDELSKTFPEQIAVIWVDIPNQSSEESQRASLAARAAYRYGGVEGFDRMRRLLLDVQNKPNAFAPFAFGQYADSLGLPHDDFRKGMQDPELIGEITRDAQQARQMAIANEVPAFLVCGSDFCMGGGYYLIGGQPRRAFEKRVRLVLAAQGGPLPTSPR
jgi:protein-disulfide isomerase